MGAGAIVSKSGLRELERAAEQARKDAVTAERAARQAKALAVKAAAQRVAAEAELDLQRWARVQIDELGIAEDDVDLEGRLIRNLPPGPTFDERPGA